MVVKYGMTDELGPICYGQQSGEVFLGKDMGHVKDYSEETAAKIDRLIQGIVKDAYSKAESLLSENVDKLHEIAKYLMKYEKMHNDDFEKVMNGTFVWPQDEE
jgi:cell division protease FtsH